MASANLFSQYLQPVKTVADYTAEADQQDLRRQQLIGAQRNNALQALVAQQTTQQMADASERRNALQAAYDRVRAKPSFTQQDLESELMNNPLTAEEGLKRQKERLGNEATVAKTAGDLATAGKTKAETADKVIGTYKQALDTIQTPQQAAQWLAAQYQDPALSDHMNRMGPLQDAVSRIPADPQQFMAWKQQAAMGMTKYAEFIAPKPVEVKLGNRVAFVDTNPNSPTYRKEVTQAAIGQSPDNAATVAATLRGQNLTDARARETNQLTREANANVYDSERGVLVNKATAQARPAMGTDGKPLGEKDKPLNDSQSKALLFGSRMQEADKVLQALSADGTNASIPGATSPIINAVSSANQQSLTQAKRDFMTAVLRRESGASIAPSEFATADAQYFPQVGDSQAVIDQKARNRALVIRGILAEVPEKQRGSISTAPSGQPQKATAPAAGPFADAAKEARYQAWKASQGK